MKFSLTVVVTFVALLAALGTSSASAAGLQLRPSSGRKPRDPKLVFEKLNAMFENLKNFGPALDEFSRSADNDYCRIEGFTCNDQNELEAIHLDNPVGLIRFDQVPTTVSRISTKGGKLAQGPDFYDVPHWVRNIEFVDTQLQRRDTGFHRKHSGLQVFKCINCNLGRVRGLPPLLELDLSRNTDLELERAKLPLTLRSLRLSGCNLDMGLEELGTLSPSLTTLDLSFNNFHGEVALDFPPYLEVLLLHHNKLSGTLTVDDLPSSIRHVDVSFNAFSGPLKGFTALVQLNTFIANGNQIDSVPWQPGDFPASLQRLELANNKLSGPLPLAQLPAALQHLNVSGNELAGELDLMHMPRVLETLDVSRNKFSGTPVLSGLHDAIRFLLLNDNEFSGTPDLSRLPVDLRRVVISGNKWKRKLPTGMKWPSFNRKSEL